MDSNAARATARASGFGPRVARLDLRELKHDGGRDDQLGASRTPPKRGNRIQYGLGAGRKVQQDAGVNRDEPVLVWRVRHR